jgi:hypothetical protein
MKLKRNQYNKEVMTTVSFQKMIQHLIKYNLKLAQNGKNKIRLDILE